MLSQTFSWEVEHASSPSGAVGNTDNKKPDRNQKYDSSFVEMDGDYLNEMNCQHGWTKRALADFCLCIW